MNKYWIGEKVLAFEYDSIGYYRGNDLGDAVPVEILDFRIIENEVLYLTKDKDKNWKVYTEMELFKTQEEIDKLP